MLKHADHASLLKHTDVSKSKEAKYSIATLEFKPITLKARPAVIVNFRITLSSALWGKLFRVTKANCLLFRYVFE